MIDFEDLAELDRQYDIAIAVPDIQRTASKLLEEGKRLREDNAAYREFFYGGDELQNLDYFPASTSSPLLVYIHGGYWHRFDKSFFSNVGQAWNAVGVSVAVINYRLAPIASMGVIVDDVRRAIVWLWKNAEKLDFDATNIVLAGSSAGGHLTAMMLATEWSLVDSSLPSNLVKGGVSISGLHDLSPFLRAPFLKDVIGLTPDDVDQYSPAGLLPPTNVPVITCVGGDESPAFHAQNRLLAERWPINHKLDVLAPATNHVTVNALLVDPASDLFRATQSLF
ncbi:MAG: alpha/beta hydrolase [Pseudomonadota bacterium]